MEVIEEAGYQWNRLAGTSGGAIFASLLAAGYTGKEVNDLMVEFPYDLHGKKINIGKVPLLGPWLSLAFYNGMNHLTILEDWLTNVLKAKGIHTFGDLPENKLKVIVTDITQQRMTVLPDDLPSYDVGPHSFPIAKAVRMSRSIPFIFIPNKLHGYVMIDGGVLSNYPIWIFDVNGTPRWPTFGFRLTGSSTDPQPKQITGPINTTIALIRTMLEAHDKRYIGQHSADRTIFIKDIDIASTDFNISLIKKLQLIKLVSESAKQFLEKWDFDSYVKKYRTSKYRN